MQASFVCCLDYIRLHRRHYYRCRHLCYLLICFYNPVKLPRGAPVDKSDGLSLTRSQWVSRRGFTSRANPRSRSAIASVPKYMSKSFDGRIFLKNRNNDENNFFGINKEKGDGIPALRFSSFKAAFRSLLIFITSPMFQVMTCLNKLEHLREKRWHCVNIGSLM